MTVSASATTAFKHNFTLSVVVHIGNDVAVDGFYHRTHRHLYFQIGSAFAVAVFLGAVFSVFRTEVLLKVKGVESVFRRGGNKHNVPALASVPSVGTAVGHVLFRVQTCRTVSAVARLYENFYFVYKHNYLLYFLSTPFAAFIASATA